MELPHAVLPAEAEAFRREVRDFLRDKTPFPPMAQAGTWMAFDAEFSRMLGAAGLIGITAPPHLGGRGADAFCRYVVCEELLAAGAPVSAHWISDRQSVPLLLQFGSRAQQERYIPGVNRGETFFCIGMSEPNSGSDLASISSRAVRDKDGWRLNGAKIWTTNAHRSHFMIALVRTSVGKTRHEGLSQFIIDLRSPGVTIRPITDLTGEDHFNEVFFDDVELNDDAMIGQEGAGWSQVMAELAFERSGPERF